MKSNVLLLSGFTSIFHFTGFISLNHSPRRVMGDWSAVAIKLGLCVEYTAVPSAKTAILTDWYFRMSNRRGERTELYTNIFTQTFNVIGH